MIRLYQREDCSECSKVRAVLEQLQIAFEVVPVVKLQSERRELSGLEGLQSPEVPTLVDGDQTIQGSGPIIDYLCGKHQRERFGDPGYGLSRVLPRVAFAEAVAMAKQALSQEGFGVLTEIDVRATLKKKLDVDFPNYLILGACNPPLAHRALSAEPGIGLLLPCNVVVAEQDDASVVVSAIDPVQMFRVVGRPEVAPIAEEVAQRLQRALAAISV